MNKSEFDVLLPPIVSGYRSDWVCLDLVPEILDMPFSALCELDDGVCVYLWRHLRNAYDYGSLPCRLRPSIESIADNRSDSSSQTSAIHCMAAICVFGLDGNRDGIIKFINRPGVGEFIAKSESLQECCLYTLTYYDIKPALDKFYYWLAGSGGLVPTSSAELRQYLLELKSDCTKIKRRAPVDAGDKFESILLAHPLALTMLRAAIGERGCTQKLVDMCADEIDEKIFVDVCERVIIKLYYLCGSRRIMSTIVQAMVVSNVAMKFVIHGELDMQFLRRAAQNPAGSNNSAGGG